MSLARLTPLALALAVTPALHAAPIVLEGNYVRTAVSDNGTLGYGGTTPPGLIHDATGTGNFDNNDYLTPGTPHEVFSIRSNQTGLVYNNNTGSTSISGLLTDTTATSGFDQSVNWTGTYDDFFTISTDTYFNDGDERVSFKTTFTALQDLTGLEFLRSIDPDPDVQTNGVYNTVNGRGGSGLPAQNWVHSEGSATGLTLGLYSNSPVTHNTGVSAPWSVDPSDYLAGVNDGNGDYAIGLAFDVGALLAGASIELEYHFIMGSALDEVDIPDRPPVNVPEPGTLALLAMGLAGMVRLRTRS